MLLFWRVYKSRFNCCWDFFVFIHFHKSPQTIRTRTERRPSADMELEAEPHAASAPPVTFSFSLTVNNGCEEVGHWWRLGTLPHPHPHTGGACGLCRSSHTDIILAPSISNFCTMMKDRTCNCMIMGRPPYRSTTAATIYIKISKTDRFSECFAWALTKSKQKIKKPRSVGSLLGFYFHKWLKHILRSQNFTFKVSV